MLACDSCRQPSEDVRKASVEIRTEGFLLRGFGDFCPDCRDGLKFKLADAGFACHAEAIGPVPGGFGAATPPVPPPSPAPAPMERPADAGDSR